MSLSWETSVWLTAGMALGWAAQWQWHRRWLHQQVRLAEPAAPVPAAAAAPAAPAMPDELRRLSAEVARLAEALAQREDETRRLTNSVNLLDQQMMQMHLARSPIAQPHARAA